MKQLRWCDECGRLEWCEEYPDEVNEFEDGLADLGRVIRSADCEPSEN